MQRSGRMAGILCAATVAIGLAVGRAQQSPSRAAPPPPTPAAPVSSPASATTPQSVRPDEKLPASVLQWRAMYLDHALFQPDTMWTYEGADDRPNAHNVEQNGFVRFGNRLVGNHGARVCYIVDSYPNDKSAHAAFVKRVPKTLARPGAVRVNRRLRSGNESVESVLTSLQQGEIARILRQSFLRYGRYVIEIGAEADMRAPVDRPERGERPWMCEPVYTRVRVAVQDKWSHYKSLLSDDSRLTVAP